MSATGAHVVLSGHCNIYIVVLVCSDVEVPCILYVHKHIHLLYIHMYMHVHVYLRVHVQYVYMCT